MGSDVFNRVVRTLLQLLAAGGFTALFEALTDFVPSQYVPLVYAIFMMMVTLAQNILEDTGAIPKFLKPDLVVIDAPKREPTVL